MASPYRIDARDDLTSVAFKVCSALAEAGIQAILTGGSAAAVYAPEAYQSRDLDFVASWVTKQSAFAETLRLLGFFENGRIFSHPQTALTLDFPDQELRIGSDFVTRSTTLKRGKLVLNLLTATDSVCDRLASFYWFDDRSALKAALAVALNQDIDMDHIADWSRRHEELPKFREFQQRLALLMEG